MKKYSDMKMIKKEETGTIKSRFCSVKKTFDFDFDYVAKRENLESLREI